MSYNGWSNYETWRANLEFFDGMTLEDLYFDPKNHSDATYQLADTLKEYMNEFAHYATTYPNETMESNASGYNFVQSLVDDFCARVDYVEIAEHMMADWIAENRPAA